LHCNSRLFFCAPRTYIPEILSPIDAPPEPIYMTDNQKPKFNKWIVFGVLLALAVLMYTSIMYKIINFGP